MALPSDVELGKAIEVARRVARKFALRTGSIHRLDDYEGAALEVVAKAYRSWDDTFDVPFPAWAGRRAQGAVVDEHRRWYGQARHVAGTHADTVRWNAEADAAGYVSPSAEDVALIRDEAARALAALDVADRRRQPRFGKFPPSSRSVILGSAVGRTQVAMAAGGCDYTRVCQILRSARVVVDEVLAS